MKAGQWDNVSLVAFTTGVAAIDAVTRQSLKQVVIRDVPIPEPGPGEVLIKVKSASLW